MPRRTQTAPIDIPHVSHAASAPTTPYGLSGYDYISVSQAQQPSHMAHGWANLQYSPGTLVHHVDGPHKYKHFPLALVTDNLPSAVDSVGSDVDYMSPISHQSFPREEMHFVPSPPILYDGYTTHSANTSTTHQTSPVPSSPPSTIVVDHTRAPTSCPSLVFAPSEPSSSLNSHIDTFESHLGHKMMRECANLSEHQPELIPAYTF